MSRVVNLYSFKFTLPNDTSIVRKLNVAAFTAEEAANAIAKRAKGKKIFIEETSTKGPIEIMADNVIDMIVKNAAQGQIPLQEKNIKQEQNPKKRTMKRTKTKEE